MGHWSSADLQRPLSFGNVMRAHHNPEASFSNFFSAIRGLFGFSFYSLLALIGPLKSSCNQTQLTRIKVVWTEYNQRGLPVKLHLHNNYWWEVHDNMGKKSKCFSPNRAEEKKSPKTVLKSMHVSNKEYQKCASDWSFMSLFCQTAHLLCIISRAPFAYGAFITNIIFWLLGWI